MAVRRPHREGERCHLLLRPGLRKQQGFVALVPHVDCWGLVVAAEAIVEDEGLVVGLLLALWELRWVEGVELISGSMINTTNRTNPPTHPAKHPNIKSSHPLGLGRHAQRHPAAQLAHPFLLEQQSQRHRGVWQGGQEDADADGAGGSAAIVRMGRKGGDGLCMFG